MEETTKEQMDVYPLDEETLSLFAEIKAVEAQFIQQANQQAAAFVAQRQGALMLFIRQHKLPGNWRIAENERELIRQHEEPKQT